MFRRGKLPFVSNKDDRIKIFNERVNLTEKHVLEITNIFADCARKIAKYRDSYDELAKGFKTYAEEEEINESLSGGMKSFTNAITILADFMDINEHRIELKIVNELAQFESLCKSTRETLRAAVIARDKEVLKQRHMMEIKSKFAANNSAADSELLKSKVEVNRANKEIDEIFTNFEKRKLNELKGTLTNFILISIKFHTKALEALSASYYDVCNIDEKDDLLVFQKIMKTKEEQPKKSMLKKGLRSQSMDSLDRDKLLSPIKRKSRISRSSKNLTKSDDELDAEEDDDEEEEEEQSNDDNSNDDESGSISEDEEDDDEEDAGTESHSEEKAPPKLVKKISSKVFKAHSTANTNQTSKEQTEKPIASKSKMSSGGSRLVTIVKSKN